MQRATWMLALVAATTLSLNAQTTTLPAGAEKAAAVIDRPTLEAPIRFLSDDLLEGRGPATRGDELTQLYLAHQMQALGLKPAFAGGKWEQPFDIVGVDTTAPESLTFSGKNESTSVKRREDFIATSGMQQPVTSIKDAELVFVGYGIEAPEFKWDDYKGVDVRGKILVMLNNDPDWDPKLFEGNRRLYYGRWTYKYEIGAKKGAAGVLIVHTTPSAGYPFTVVQTSWSGEQFELPAENEPRLQFRGWMTEDATRRVLKTSGHDLDKLIASARSPKFKPVPLGVRTSIDLTAKVSKKSTANVGGILEGSDPVLKHEVVVYSAHHDHLGIGDPDDTGDAIYNGAMDNASGSSLVLGIARAFTALPAAPKRSVMFLFVAAEEQGLLGSGYYASHPHVPAGRLAANINFDGASILGRTRDISIVGRGKSSLEKVAEHFATQQGRVVKGEEFPDRGFYYRSDQFNFAKVGVPALYFDAGTDIIGLPEGTGRKAAEEWEAKNYHQPSDEINDSWNYEGMIEDARLGFYVGLATANSDVPASWTPGDEFEATRKKALAAVARPAATKE